MSGFCASAFRGLLAAALERRAPLLESLAAEGTSCWRVFHGAAEGLPGLTADFYGGLLLAQTFREALAPAEAAALEEELRRALPAARAFAYNHRGKKANEPFDMWHRPSPEALEEFTVSEGGVKFLIRARHRGIDPWLFLDLRAARREARRLAPGRSVLNLFAYTCGVGVAACAAGAAEAWNVDFSESALEVGRRNAALNGLAPGRCTGVNGDCLAVSRQLAGLPAGGRYGRRPRLEPLRPRSFGLVFLDPPTWSKGPLGAVDIVRDYQTVFKPALLAAEPGGAVIAVNHAAQVEFSAWEEVLRRCAAKAGRPLRALRRLEPDPDFPSFDGNPPLKAAVCEV